MPPEETFEVSTFSLGLHVEPGQNRRADRYTMDELLNVDVDLAGAIVTRKGSRRVISSWSMTSIDNMLVADVEGVPTFFLSGIESGGDGSEGSSIVRLYSLSGSGIGMGNYDGGTGIYSRAVTVAPYTPASITGWRGVLFRGYIYMSAGNRMPLNTGASTNQRTHNGNFRWTWNHGVGAVHSKPLQDWSPDSLGDLLEQDVSLSTPTIRATTATVISPSFDTFPRYLGQGTSRLEIARAIGHRTQSQPVLFSGSPSFSGTLSQGRYYYALAYGRSDSLGQSAGYGVDVMVPEDDMAVVVENIPTHPDPTVDTIRIYRNVSATEPELRLLAEIPNGDASFVDDGEDLVQSGEVYVPHTPLPTAQALAVHLGRIWFAGSSAAGNVIHYTGQGAPENTSLSEALVVGPYPSSTVVAMASTGLQSEQETTSGPLLAFTPTATYAILGNPPDVIIRPRSEQVGCQAPRSVASYEQRVFWLGDNGVYASDGGALRRISRPSGERAGAWSIGNIDGRLSGVSANVLRKASGAVANHQYYLAVTDNRGLERVYVFDIQRGIWTERSYPFSITALYTYRTRSGGESLYAASTSGNVFELEVGDADEDDSAVTTAITWNAKMNANWFGNKGQRKRFRRLRVITDRNRAITFRTYVGATVAKQTKTLAVGSGLTWDDGTLWDSSGSTWRDRAERRIKQGLLDTNIGVNLQVEVAGTGPHRIESVAVDMRRMNT